MEKALKRLQQALADNQKVNYAGENAEKARQLVEEGQKPDYFFIACSDSRYAPHALPGINYGDIFTAKHIAALVPPYDAPESSAIAAATDFAVDALGVKHIIIMGHTHCGGIQGIVTGQAPGAVGKWLNTAHSDVLKDLDSASDIPHKCAKAEKNAIIWSYNNLAEYPAVKKAMAENRLKIHGWRYNIENGSVEAYDPETQSFVDFFSAETGTDTIQTAAQKRV